MTAAVPPIFRSELQLRMLGLILLDPERAWTTRDLAEALDSTQVSIHRELRRALESGVVTRRSVGRTFLYTAAEDSPLIEPLRTLLERTVGVGAQLREALADVPGVESAFVHGSFAKSSTTRPPRDVDLLVLGTSDPHLLRRRVRLVEKRIGREIDVTLYSPEEFADLVRDGNGFARAIALGPVAPLIGSLDDLPRVA